MGYDNCSPRDPIHGFIDLTSQEAKIVDTPVFQRLRNIKQLAHTSLVFPSATHTRFEHSLGTLCVADKMVSRLRIDVDDEDTARCIRLAALLHDLGHGPFSHVSEEIVSRIIESTGFDNVSIALDAIESDRELRKNLGSDFERVSDILDQGEKEGFEYDIVNGPIDADKHDYLARDSYFTGVPYGIFDSLRVISSICGIKEPSHAKPSLGISWKGVEAVQSLGMARYNMHRVVYSHKTRTIADAMTVRSVMIAMEDERCLDCNYFAYSKGDEDFLKHYFSLDDRLLVDFVVKNGKESGEMMKSVLNRRLLKIAYELDLEKIEGPRGRRIQKLNHKDIRRYEDEIAESVSIPPHWVIVARQTIDNPTYRNPVGLAPDNRKLLVTQKGKTQPFFLDEMPGIWGSDRKLILNRLWVFSRENDKKKVEKAAEGIFSSI